MEIWPDTVCSPEPLLNLAEIHGVLCQPDLARSAAATIIEDCVRRLWPHDQDMESLIPEIRHILECELTFQEWLCQLRNDNDNVENHLRSACQLLTQSAAALSSMRSGSNNSL